MYFIGFLLVGGRLKDERAARKSTAPRSADDRWARPPADARPEGRMGASPHGGATSASEVKRVGLTRQPPVWPSGSLRCRGRCLDEVAVFPCVVLALSRRSRRSRSP